MARRTAENPMQGVVGVIEQDGRLLVIRRSKTVRVPLVWCFPGGEIEPGESQADALVREMREELHIEVGPDKCLMTQTKHSGRLVLYCWSANILSGTPTPNPREVAAVEWMTPAEIRVKEDILPGMMEILDEIGC